MRSAAAAPETRIRKETRIKKQRDADYAEYADQKNEIGIQIKSTGPAAWRSQASVVGRHSRLRRGRAVAPIRVIRVIRVCSWVISVA